MKYVKCDKPERKSKWHGILEEFSKSGDSCWQIDYEPGEYSNPESLRTTIRGAIKRYHFNQIREFIADGVVYIERKEL